MSSKGTEFSTETPIRRWCLSESIVLSVAPLVLLSSLIAGVIAGGFWWPVSYGVEDLSASSASANTLEIAKNNLTLAFSLFVLSAATAGLGTLVTLFINGLIVGQLAVLLIRNSLGHMLLAGLLPHALLEAVGLCLVGTAGLVFPLALIRFLVPLKRTITKKALFLRSVKLLSIGCLIIVIAAIVEDHVSNVTWQSVI